MDAICHGYLQLTTIIGTALPLERPPLNKVARGEGEDIFLVLSPPPQLDHYRRTRRHDTSTLLENATDQKTKHEEQQQKLNGLSWWKILYVALHT